jgi:hypothetical protein
VEARAVHTPDTDASDGADGGVMLTNRSFDVNRVIRPEKLDLHPQSMLEEPQLREDI